MGREGFREKKLRAASMIQADRPRLDRLSRVIKDDRSMNPFRLFREVSGSGFFREEDQ
jgi:hypothetical protein